MTKEVAKAVGRKPRDGDTQSRPRVLDGLYYCAKHDRRLYVGGTDGKYLFCADCRGLPIDQRPLFSQLPRKLALRKTDRKSTRLNSSHTIQSRMPSSA